MSTVRTARGRFRFCLPALFFADFCPKCGNLHRLRRFPTACAQPPPFSPAVLLPFIRRHVPQRPHKGAHRAGKYLKFSLYKKFARFWLLAKADGVQAAPMGRPAMDGIQALCRRKTESSPASPPNSKRKKSSACFPTHGGFLYFPIFRHSCGIYGGARPHRAGLPSRILKSE